jgi:hypothetical protein
MPAGSAFRRKRSADRPTPEGGSSATIQSLNGSAPDGKTIIVSRLGERDERN